MKAASTRVDQLSSSTPGERHGIAQVEFAALQAIMIIEAGTIRKS